MILVTPTLKILERQEITKKIYFAESEVGTYLKYKRIQSKIHIYITNTYLFFLITLHST